MNFQSDEIILEIIFLPRKPLVLHKVLMKAAVALPGWFPNQPRYKPVSAAALAQKNS